MLALLPFASTNAQLGHWCSQTCSGSLWLQKESLIPSYLIICAEQATVPQECGQLVECVALLGTLYLLSAAMPAQKEQSSFWGVITRKFVQIPPSWQLPGKMKYGCTFKKEKLCASLCPVRCPSTCRRLYRFFNLFFTLSWDPRATQDSLSELHISACT